MCMLVFSNTYAASNGDDDNEQEFSKAMTYIEKGKTKKACAILEKLSNVNYLPACHQLGIQYLTSSPENACKEFKKVIEQTYPEKNSGTEAESYFYKDTKKAIFSMFPPGISTSDAVLKTKGAASEGNEKNMFLYAGYLETSKGKEAAQDIVKYYESATRHGMGAAAYHLAMLYENGTILEKDMTKAAEFYRKASETCMPDFKPGRLAVILITEISENTMVIRENNVKKEPTISHYIVAEGDEPHFIKVLRISDEFLDIDTHMKFLQTGSAKEATNLFSIPKGETIKLLNTEITDTHHEMSISYDILR